MAADTNRAVMVRIIVLMMFRFLTGYKNKKGVPYFV